MGAWQVTPFNGGGSFLVNIKQMGHLEGTPPINSVLPPYQAVACCSMLHKVVASYLISLIIDGQSASNNAAAVCIIVIVFIISQGNGSTSLCAPRTFLFVIVIIACSLLALSIYLTSRLDSSWLPSTGVISTAFENELLKDTSILDPSKSSAAQIVYILHLMCII